LENSPVFSSRVLKYFLKLPSKVHFNLSLFAFLESDIVGIVKVINSFVWSPILNSSVIGCSILELLLSKESFIIEGEEIESFILERESWLIENEISMEVLPSSIIILV